MKTSRTSNEVPGRRVSPGLGIRAFTRSDRVVGGRAEKVFVKVIRRDGGRVLVDGPLQVGDLMVVEGVQGLRDGQPVEPRPFGYGQAGAIGRSGNGGFS